ncbi:hypothetical protein D3C71_139810 [compost metagenome]
MAGTQTHGFDMVIEISTLTIQNLLSATFDNDGLLGSLLPGTIGSLDGFGLSVDFNRPSGIPASAANPVRLLFNLNFSSGNSGTLEVVVGMDVDRTDSDFDKVILDFVNKIFRCTLSVSGIPTAITNVAATFIQDKLNNNNIPLIPIPVNRTSTSTTSITRADVKVIDDSTATNNDAIGIMLTYGGGAAGNMNDFTSAFSREGAGAAVAINFDWICRNISPRIESGIGLPAGSFSGCTFNGDFEIREGVRLTNLSVRPADDHIVLTGRVAKSGFCYEASGSFTARIRVAIVGGELRVSFETDNPDIDLDIPWYCWIGAAVLGALLGGVIFGVTGTIVGAIIVPLLLWIAQSVIESTIENITGQVTDSINGIDDISIQLVGIDTILDQAFIDDLTVTYDMSPREYWPVKSEGVLTVRSGQYFDLDNGIIKNEQFGGADLRLEGWEQGRNLKVLCGSAIAPLANGKPFSSMRHFDLLMLSYGITGNLPLPYFANYIPIPFISDQYFETGRLTAIRTSDNALGIFVVINVTRDEFIIRYKTYKSDIYTLDFSGNFSCKPFRFFDEHIKLEEATYIDARNINNKMQERLTALATQSQKSVAHVMRSAVPAAASANKMERLPVMVDENILKAQIMQINKPAGNWIGRYITVRDKKTANFTARINGNLQVTTYTWVVDGHALGQQASGVVKVKNEDFEYTTNGKTLTLGSKSAAELDVPIKLMVTFDNGIADSIIKCIPYKNTCTRTQRIVPSIGEYLAKFDKEYGIVRI